MEFPKLFSSDEIDDRVYGNQPVTVVVAEPDPRDVIKQYHPHISTKIELLWGTPELHHYLNTVIMDNRHYRTGESRQGFRPEVINALLKLYQQHSERLKQPKDDVWLNSK
jgi:hypothetical protein